MESLFSQLQLNDYHGDLYRNIVSLRVSEDLFDDLSEDPAVRASGLQLENATKPHFFTNDAPVIFRPFQEAEWNEAIQYPFRNSSQSRFSDGTFGIWYGGDRLETTVHETVHHWQTKLLGDAQGFLQPGVQIERKVYLVRCDAALIDLRPKVPAYPALVDPLDYTATHAVGRKMHHEGHPGLINKSARCDGDIYAAFNPRILSQPRQQCFLTYITQANGRVRVERAPGELLLEV